MLSQKFSQVIWKTSHLIWKASQLLLVIGLETIYAMKEIIQFIIETNSSQFLLGIILPQIQDPAEDSDQQVISDKT